MTVPSWRKMLFYALAAVAPGGFVAVAGYHAYKLIKAKRDKARTEDGKS